MTITFSTLRASQAGMYSPQPLHVSLEPGLDSLLVLLQPTLLAMQLLHTVVSSTLFIVAVLAAIPHIEVPSNGTIIKPGAAFDFQYQSIADYGTSSFNYTVWLFTSPPTSFVPVDNYATGYYFGRFAEPNYPGNPSPQNLPPKQLNMPNFATLGSGAQADNATFYLTVMEEYATGVSSLGYRISLVYNHIRYNATTM